VTRRKKNRTASAGEGIPFGAIVAEHLKDDEFRAYFEERQMVHEVAIAVKTMRERAGLTQAELAEKIGSSQPSIARIEKGGGYRTPQWETLNKIARALGMRMKVVFATTAGGRRGAHVEVDGLPAAPDADYGKVRSRPVTRREASS
jgi:DNA-binding XRE family transcriptional regulator